MDGPGATHHAHAHDARPHRGTARGVRRGSRCRAFQLPAQPGPDARHWSHRRRQHGGAETFRDDPAVREVVCGAAGESVAESVRERGAGRHPEDHCVAGAAVGLHLLHGQPRCGKNRQPRRRQTPHPHGDGAWRQGPRGGDRVRYVHRRGRQTHRAGKVHQRWADVHGSRLRPRAPLPAQGTPRKPHEIRQAVLRVLATAER
mmetsp:Transcript_44745/g.90385  ORF Transcript_44745/g.90385 Transcript_44745/m.90385 type:complete len:202 (+) Transcript_44745:264-869(+)